MEKQQQKGRWRETLPVLLCDPCIRTLVDLKGCRLWRQQLAAFMWVELTGSCALKQLRGMCFSTVDRWQFSFPPRIVTLQVVWRGSQIDLALLFWVCTHLAVISWNDKCLQLIFVSEIDCDAEKKSMYVNFCACDLQMNLFWVRKDFCRQIYEKKWPASWPCTGFITSDRSDVLYKFIFYSFFWQ